MKSKYNEKILFILIIKLIGILSSCTLFPKGEVIIKNTNNDKYNLELNQIKIYPKFQPVNIIALNETYVFDYVVFENPGSGDSQEQSQTFVIENNSEYDVNINKDILITGSGSNSFNISKNPSTVIGSHSSTEITIDFDPDSIGVKDAEIAIEFLNQTYYCKINGKSYKRVTANEIIEFNDVGTTVWNVPDGYEYVKASLVLVGGGGSGALGDYVDFTQSADDVSYDVSCNHTFGGGGGGSGEYKIQNIDLISDVSYELTVGDGGTGTIGGIGINGQDSIFKINDSNIITAEGGFGGLRPDVTSRTRGGYGGLGWTNGRDGGYGLLVDTLYFIDGGTILDDTSSNARGGNGGYVSELHGFYYGSGGYYGGNGNDAPANSGGGGGGTGGTFLRCNAISGNGGSGKITLTIKEYLTVIP